MKLLLTAILMWNIPGGWAMNNAEVSPGQDTVMATPSEIQAVHDWVLETFAKERPQSWADRVGLEVRRQDHNTLHFRQSCLETPLRIGSRSFERGLGTHANSEIAVVVPEQARTFTACVGIDNNYDTQGSRGTARFSVDVDGIEVIRTDILRGGNEPKEIRVTLPDGARELILKVDDAGDGPAFDQADWAEASFKLGDGRVLWLDEGYERDLLLSTAPPFSFQYGGTPSSEFLDAWQHSSNLNDLGDRLERQAKWKHAESGLVVTVNVNTTCRNNL